MRAARLSAPRSVGLVDRELPALRGHEVRIAITECGLCGSDLDLWLGHAPGKLPMFIGHEPAGVVAEIGEEVTTLRPGDHVVAWVPDGGFAEQVVAEAGWCVPIRPDVAFPAIAEPLGCAVNTVELAQPRLGDDVVIVGGGFMATLIQLLSRRKGARSVTVISASEATRARALTLGATHALAPDQPADDIIARIGAAADVVYEVTGDPQRLVLAGDLTRMSGTLCIAGYHQSGEGNRTVPLARWNHLAFTIVNAHFRNLDTILSGMRVAVRLLEAGAIDLAALSPQHFALNDIDAAFAAAAAREPDFVKAVVQP